MIAWRLSIRLGSWFYSPNQVWPYYFNPDSDTIICPISKDKARQHPRTMQEGRRYLQYFHHNSQLIDLSTTVPAALIPAEGNRQPNQGGLAMSIGTSTFKDSRVTSQLTTLKDCLPSYRNRLLARCNPSHPLSLETALQRLTSPFRVTPL